MRKVFSQVVEIATGVPLWMLWAAALFALILAGVATWKLARAVRPFLEGRES